MVKRIWGAIRAIASHHDEKGGGSGAGLFDLTVRWPDRLASLMVVRLILWLAIAVWVHQGFYSDPFKLADWMDDHQFYAWETADRETLLRWGQLPAWNPYWCGGTVGIAAPEDPFLGPDFLLRIVFGVAHGRRLAILLLVVMGFEGMYRLCRRLDSTVAAAGFAAVVYGTCDRFVNFVHDGWINFLGFELLPWVVLCFVKGLESWRWRLLGGFFFAWIVLSAGTYTTPFTLLTLAYLTFAFAGRGLFSKNATGKRPWLTPLVVTSTIGVVALFLAFGKLVPTLAFLRQFPRVFAPVEVHVAPEIFAIFWSKYGIVLALAALAVVLLDTAAAIFFGGFLFAFAMAMGDFGPYSPFHLLKALPIFSQLRFPDRYIVLVLFFAAVAAARGITRLEDAVPALVKRLVAAIARWRKWESVETPRELIWIAVGFATLCSVVVVRGRLEAVLETVRVKAGSMYLQEPAHVYDGEFKQSRGNRRDVHIFAAANMGSIYCVAGNPLPESPLLRGDLAQEEYPVDPSKATVKRLMWSPNEIQLEVDAKAPTTIRVNQNYAAEWQTNVGTVKSDQKLLAVDVPAGKNVVVLAYKDRALTFCLLVSLASLLGLVFVFGREGARWFVAERKRWSEIETWPDEEAAADGEEPAAEDDAPAQKDDEPAKSSDDESSA